LSFPKKSQSNKNENKFILKVFSPVCQDDCFEILLRESSEFK
jgi:hypothetical protein